MKYSYTLIQFRGTQRQAVRLAVFHALCSVISQLLTQMTMNSSSWSRSWLSLWIIGMLFFRRVQGIVTKEGMLLKTSIISATAGALLLLALLRLHGRASLDSCSSRASRDHKARTGHLRHCMSLLRRSVALRVCSHHIARWQCLTRSKPLALRMVQTTYLLAWQACRETWKLCTVPLSCKLRPVSLAETPRKEHLAWPQSRP